MVTLLIVLGAALGTALACKGWLNTGGILAIVSSVAPTAIGILGGTLKVEALRSTIVFAREYRSHILGLGWGFIGGLFLPLLVGALVVFLVSLLKNRQKGNLDAWSFAGRQANYLFVHGVRDYLAAFAPSSVTVKERWNERRLEFQSLLLDTARRTLAGVLTEQRFKDTVHSLGATFLRQLFEADQTIKDYRLAVYRISSDKTKFEPLVTVNKGDWSSHSSEPLLLDKSFMGEALSEGKPLVYPRDKKQRKFQNRRKKNRFHSFLAVPLPCDTSAPSWGALSIDYVGNEQVFSKERVEAAADFARAVDLLYGRIVEAQPQEVNAEVA